MGEAPPTRLNEALDAIGELAELPAVADTLLADGRPAPGMDCEERYCGTPAREAVEAEFRGAGTRSPEHTGGRSAEESSIGDS